MLYERKKEGPLQKQEIEAYTSRNVEAREYTCTLPMQVHEILIAHGEIKNPIQTHCGEEALEISKSDWIYRMEFDVPSQMNQYLLKCNGLDTIVHVYLNGIKIGAHSNMFYPFETEIFPETHHVNILLFHFHSPVRYLETMKALHQENCYIDPAHYMRKAPHDFEDFLGIKPYLATVGIYEDVVIEAQKKARIKEMTVNYNMSEDLKSAVVNLEVQGEVLEKGQYHIRCILEDEEEKVLFVQEKEIQAMGLFETKVQTERMQVELWWPSQYGKQVLYTCKVYLEEETELDCATKKIGFRQIEFRGDFDLYVNGVSVKLWGANLVPINGLTHCFDAKRAEKILWLAKHANMNIIRFWGGGEPYPDELYDMADQMGLLIWGEFFHKWGMYPEEEEHLEHYRREATYMLKTFRHHAAVIMWCGGNESQMGAELDFPGKPYVGDTIFKEYERLCGELHPEAYFQKNSPLKGTFVNDPREGDFHGWNHLWYVPYDRFPVMFSENSRVSPPILKSLKKYIPDPEKLWPTGFQSRRTCYEDNLLPPAWMKLKTGPEPYWCSPVEQFYDAKTPEELIYQCQAAHGKLMKQIGERLKRGRPAWQKDGERKCKGQLIWKLNDSWPQIFCSLLDYNLEVGIPYYTVKRVYQAIQVSFDMEDHITIWAVNDSCKDFEGTIEFVLFDPVKNKPVHQFKRDVQVWQGKSKIICDLDYLTQFKREYILYACLKDKMGEVAARNYEFVEIERNLYFPDAKVTLKKEGTYVIVSTNQFARCITLESDMEEPGDGFVFEDNYFDLLPFEERKIKVNGQAMSFKITAKAFYATKSSTIEFKQEE